MSKSRVSDLALIRPSYSVIVIGKTICFKSK